MLQDVCKMLQKLVDANYQSLLNLRDTIKEIFLQRW
jgi:hypothetical protein